MRFPELDEAADLARRQGAPELAEILERLELPERYIEQTERYVQATAAARARQQLDDMKAQAKKALAGGMGEDAQKVARHWASKEGVDQERPELANSAALGRLHQALGRIPRPRGRR
jgi:hypothetical protein